MDSRAVRKERYSGVGFGLGPTGPWGSAATEYGVRSGDLKLVMPLQGTGPPLLFNLATDIGETTNLSKTQPSDVASLCNNYGINGAPR